MNRARAIGALLVLAGVLGCGGATQGDGAATGPESGPRSQPAGWHRLPDGPLSPRTEAVTAWTGRELVVVGGTQFVCGEGAECAEPADPPRRDGAAYDPTTEQWRPIAPAPVPLQSARPAVVGREVYVLAACADDQCTSSRSQLLRYRPGADAWDTLPGPPPDGFYDLATAGDGLVAYSTTDEHGEQPDWWFDPGTGRWRELPDDPLPPSYDRHVVPIGDDLLVFAKQLHTGSPELPPIIGARLDLASGTWEELPPAPASGFQAWVLDGLVVINPHFGAVARGGIFDPATGRWRALPDPPEGPGWDPDLAGALGRDTAVYAYQAGWVLDVPSESWVEIPPLDGRATSGVGGHTAMGRSLFVFGGVRWPEPPDGAAADDRTGGPGELLAEAWVWTPPSAAGEA